MKDSQTNVQALKDLVAKFCQERDWDQFHTPKELAIGISTEASELLEIFRFQTEAEVQELLHDELKREAISDELADVFFFVLRFAQRFQLDLVQALKNKTQKNALKYPVDKSRGSNKKYTEF